MEVVFIAVASRFSTVEERRKTEHCLKHFLMFGALDLFENLKTMNLKDSGPHRINT